MKESKWKNSLTGILGVLLVAVILWILSAGREEVGGGYGAFSLLPAVIAITLAFLTREVLVSLFLAIVVGGIVSGDPNVIQKFLIPAIGSSQFGLILLVYLWCLGGLIGIWTRTGGAQAFAQWAAGRLVKGRRSAKFFGWLMGVVFHQGGTISTVLAGTTVRPVTDKERVSHEELSYIVDSTASPVAGIIPLNVWPIYVSGLVVGAIPLLPDQASAISFFYRSIPFNFYGIFA
ncbi:MAG: sodium:proton antiporter, partial [Acidobacteriota bacterium]